MYPSISPRNMLAILQTHPFCNVSGLGVNFNETQATKHPHCAVYAG